MEGLLTWDHGMFSQSQILIYEGDSKSEGSLCVQSW